MNIDITILKDCTDHIIIITDTKIKNMKTILSSKKEYKRVTNKVAEQEVSLGKAKYVPKSEWKKNVRDAVVSEETVVESKKTNKK